MRTADLSASAADDCGGRQRRIDAGYFAGGTGPAEKAGAGVAASRRLPYDTVIDAGQKEPLKGSKRFRGIV